MPSAWRSGAARIPGLLTNRNGVRNSHLDQHCRGAREHHDCDACDNLQILRKESTMNDERIYNAAAGLIDHNLHAGRGDKIAFIDPQRTLSYRELRDASAQMANLLRAHGFEREDRIALLALDTVDWPVMFLGAIRAGVIPIALNTLLPSQQYAYMLTDSRAQALFVTDSLFETIEPLLDDLPDLRKVFVVEGDTNTHLVLADELGAQSSEFAKGMQLHSGRTGPRSS